MLVIVLNYNWDGLERQSRGKSPSNGYLYPARTGYVVIESPMDQGSGISDTSEFPTKFHPKGMTETSGMAALVVQRCGTVKGMVQQYTAKHTPCTV